MAHDSITDGYKLELQPDERKGLSFDEDDDPYSGESDEGTENIKGDARV